MRIFESEICIEIIQTKNIKPPLWDLIFILLNYAYMTWVQLKFFSETNLKIELKAGKRVRKVNFKVTSLPLHDEAL